MIRFESVTFTYPGARLPALCEVDLDVAEGELALVVGHTGVGKSTLLRAVNGLVPHFSGGRLTGRVTVGGRDTRRHPPRELVDTVGIVLQDPRSGFVTDTVEEELAYAMESLGIPTSTMRRRVEETLDLLGLVELRDRPLRALSAGQQQRVAIGSVLTGHPRVLVLDEPTSALDPGAAEDVLAALQRLVHDLGMTVLLAEHRLERVVQFADRLVVVSDDGRVASGPARDMLETAPVVPPVVALARAQRWRPTPVTVREARRRAEPLRARLAGRPAPPCPQASTGPAATVVVESLTVNHGASTALRALDLAVRPGEVVAVMGRNGAGKTTLLRSLVGLGPVTSGRARVGGHDPQRLTPRELARTVGLVPSDPGELLWAESVHDECADADRDSDRAPGSTRSLLHTLADSIDDTTHPRDLSEGQRLALALSVVLSAGPRVLLLDEPTRGLDYEAKEVLVRLLRERAASGHAVVLATHDVELVAEVATRVVVLADGEVVADGPTREIVTGSPQFAPQVAKIMAPLPLLTVHDVGAALAVVS